MKTKGSLLYKNLNLRKDQPLRFQQQPTDDEISSINDLFKEKESEDNDKDMLTSQNSQSGEIELAKSVKKKLEDEQVTPKSK